MIGEPAEASSPPIGVHVKTASVAELARELIDRAAESPHGRTTEILHGGSGHTLRQMVIALTAGQELSEHENPGEATLFVIIGKVQLNTEGAAAEMGEGDFLIVPHERHSLDALEDSAVLLTTAINQY